MKVARGPFSTAGGHSPARYTPLIEASYWGNAEVVRALLAAGSDKRHVANNGDTAASVVCQYNAFPGSRAAILAILAAAP